MSEKAIPTDESLHVQYKELNQRSRWYTAQFWIVPFIYGGIVIKVIDLVPSSSSWPIKSSSCLALGVLGLAVLLHAYYLIDGIQRAVSPMGKIEAKLKIHKASRYSELPLVPFVVLLWVSIDILVYLALRWMPMDIVNISRLGIILSAVGALLLAFSLVVEEQEGEGLGTMGRNGNWIFPSQVKARIGFFRGGLFLIVLGTLFQL